MDEGEEEYMKKKFDKREMKMSIKNIMRSGEKKEKKKIEKIVLGNYNFLIKSRELKKGKEKIKIKEREKDIMEIFEEREGEKIKRNEMKGKEGDVGERKIDVKIKSMRRKIEKDKEKKVWIKKVRGIG